MKRNKLGIVAILALTGLMACGPVAFAQDKPATPPPGGDSGTTPPRRGRNNIQALLDKLDLTSEQKDKVKPIIADQTQKMRDLRQDTSLSQEDRRAKMKELNEGLDAKMKEVLTADQFTKYQELRKQAAAGRRGQAGGDGAGTSAT